MTAKNPGYGRPGGDPKTSTLKVGRSGIDSGTTQGNKGVVSNIPSGGGNSAKNKVESSTTQGNKGASLDYSRPKRSAPLD